MLSKLNAMIWSLGVVNKSQWRTRQSALVGFAVVKEAFYKVRSYDIRRTFFSELFLYFNGVFFPRHIARSTARTSPLLRF